jgi:hypothetical protein
MALKLRKYDRPSSEEILADLLAKATTTVEPDQWPKRLPIECLKVAPHVFQHRLLDMRPYETSAHTESLARIILDTRKPLDAMLVLLIGTDWYVVNGHHRHHAYLSASWSGSVPVVCHRGTVREAQLDALALNRKANLNMTKQELTESAWGFCKDGGRTQAQIAAASGISARTVWSMCKALRDRPECHKLSWARAGNPHFTPSDDEVDFDALKHAKAEKLMNQMFSKVSPDVANRPDILALALELRSEKIPGALIYEWREQAQQMADLDALGI